MDLVWIKWLICKVICSDIEHIESTFVDACLIVTYLYL